jgi:pantothenate kinase-related protein Tda10
LPKKKGLLAGWCGDAQNGMGFSRKATNFRGLFVVDSLVLIGWIFGVNPLDHSARAGLM